MSWARQLRWSLALFVLSSTVASACQVPVFRYALDRWEGEDFLLRTSADGDVGTANLELAAGDGELFAPFDKKTSIWKGEVDEKAVSKLVSSPKRQEIARRILAGHSAVWVVVESGEKEKDKELYDRLDDRLTFFQSVAELPEIDPNDPASQLGPGPELELKFSILRIKRGDPEEALLVKMLAGPKAAELPKDEPFVSPVFGQGRVLGAWPAETMDAEGIEEACFYLTGACSCQVKAQNPGWDLLLDVDWKKELRKAEAKKNKKAEANGKEEK